MQVHTDILNASEIKYAFKYKRICGGLHWKFYIHIIVTKFHVVPRAQQTTKFQC